MPLVEKSDMVRNHFSHRVAAMTPVRLNPLDSAWLFTESRATPNHVGGLLQFRLPERAPKDYLRKLMAGFRNHREFAPPWNRRLKYAFNKNPLPVWIEDDEIDLEYHVRHAALPWPGGERELGELVGRLQSTPLDLSRPPWKCTIIEGLEGGRFALFVKIHHSLIDGISGMKLLQRIGISNGLVCEKPGKPDSALGGQPMPAWMAWNWRLGRCLVWIRPALTARLALVGP